MIAIFVDGTNDHYTRGSNFPIGTTPKKFSVSELGVIFWGSPLFLAVFGHSHFRGATTLNFGPISTKLGGTVRAIKKMTQKDPVLKIQFGPPNTNFWSVWSSQNAHKFRQIQPTTKVRILCFDCPLHIKINNSCLLKFFIQSTSASMFNQYTYFGLKYDTCG